MARRSLKALQEKIDAENNQKESSGGLFYPHWKLPFDGVAKVRLLEDPDQSNELIVYKTFMEHRLQVGDEQIKVPCLKNLGKTHNCPICDLAKKYYDADDPINGKYYYRDLYAVLRGIIVSDGLEYSPGEETSKGKVRYLKFSFQVLKKLKSEIAKLDDEEFWDLDEGLDFLIVKDKQIVKGDEMGKYDLSSGFARKVTSIPEEYRVDILDTPLSEILPEIPSYDEVDEILQNHLKFLMDGGSKTKSYDKNPEQETTEDELMAKINRQKAEREEKVAPKVVVEETQPEVRKSKKEVVEDDENPLSSIVSELDEEDDDDILAQLRS